MITAWAFALILVVLSFLICMTLWKFLKDKSAIKIALFGVEVTVLGGIIVTKSSINNLLLSIVGYTLIGVGLILNIIALFKS